MCAAVLRIVDPQVPGSSSEWVPIFFEARMTAQGFIQAFIPSG